MELPASECWCTPEIRPNGTHAQIKTNDHGYIQFLYTDRGHQLDAYYYEPVVKADRSPGTIKQSVGVLFEEGNKTQLERIEFLSLWSGKSVETRVSARSARFIVALEFSPRDLVRLTEQGGVLRPTGQALVSIDAVKPLIADKVVRDLLSDQLSGTSFLILDPKSQDFEHRLFFAETNSTHELTIPAIVLSRTGQVLASTPVSMYLPE